MDARQEASWHWTEHIDDEGNWVRRDGLRCCYCAVLMGRRLPHRHPEDRRTA